MVIRNTNRSVKGKAVVNIGETVDTLRPYLKLDDGNLVPYLGDSCRIVHVGNKHAIDDKKANHLGYDLDLITQPLDPVTVA